MGAAPRKRHGQNFLLDDNLLGAIVRDAGVQAGERILEIGPGPGLLTRHLLAAGAHVTAVEIDGAMTTVAHELIEADLRPGLTWVEADALGGGRQLSPALLGVLPGCTRLVANLPYGISGPLIAGLVTSGTAPRHWMVMLQREMGRRMTASPGTRDYGPLAVLVATCGSARVQRKVPRQAFWPRPDVESVVMAVDLERPGPAVEELQDLEAFLAAAFHTRRKTLINSLAEAWREPTSRVVSSLNWPDSGKNLRAEELRPVQLCDLARTWAMSALGGRRRP